MYEILKTLSKPLMSQLMIIKLFRKVRDYGSKEKYCFMWEEIL